MKLFTMLKILVVAVVLLLPAAADAFTVNGTYFHQLSCKFEWNSDFNTWSYVGTYKSPSGEIYEWFFPSPEYMWCPY